VIAAITCPICSKLFTVESGTRPATLPFCSDRCRQIDLLRWSKGEYRIVEPLDPRRLEEESAPSKDEAALGSPRDEHS
jgi:endogenous inhibitor of DNA gyrase (YacG/DUF329 family)